jgi:putative RecB family exonuclease
MPLEGAQDVFQASYAGYISEMAERAPVDEWFASGPYKGMVDVERRYLIGMEQVEKYLDWYNSHPEEVIWIAPNGEPGIEIGFDIDLDGVLVRGYIDAVISVEQNWGEPEVIVRDNKTGNKPGDDFQLGVYGVALAAQFGIDPPRLGDYWMGRTGKPTHPFQIDDWTKERVTERFHDLEAKLKAGDFPALPEPNKCMFCDVATSCEYAGG